MHPKVVQERLGHATIGLTVDTYSHVLPGMGREAAAKLDALLTPPWPAAGAGLGGAVDVAKTELGGEAAGANRQAVVWPNLMR